MYKYLLFQILLSAAVITSNIGGMDPVVKITLGNQDMSSSADDTALTTMSMLTPEDDFVTRDSDTGNNPHLIPAVGMRYDQLDFNRPIRHLKPHYTSSSTLKSVKSTIGKSSREGGDGSSDDAQSPKDEDANGNGCSTKSDRHPVNYDDDGYIDCADMVRRHIDNSDSPSSFVISVPQSNNKYPSVPRSKSISTKVKIFHV